MALGKLPRESTVEDIVILLKIKAEITPEEALKAGGRDARSALVQIATDSRFDVLLRARACLSLGYFQGEGAKKVLSNIYGNEGEPLEVRAGALIGFARHEHEKAMADLKGYLEDSKPEMRVAAAKGLKEVGGEEARQMLIYALQNEEVLEVRMVIDKVLKEMR
jgi:HEAT repeat protein